MAFDRDLEWKDSVDKRAVRSVRSQVPELQAAKRAALAATQVTGDESWDLFLSIVKSRIEEREVQLQAALDSLQNSDDFSPDSVVGQKLSIRLVSRELMVLNWIIELPQILLEKGDRAKQLLGTIEESSD